MAGFPLARHVRPPGRLPATRPTFALSPAMPLFWKPYTSDVTDFLGELKSTNPELEQQQRQGRALLWDRPQDREAQARWREARVPQQPYVYQTRPEGEQA